MTINITVLSVTVSTVPTSKGSYQVADLAYKNNTFQGKVEGKKLMSFGGSKEAFGVLSLAQQGSSFHIDIVKNDKGYNDWVKATPAQVEGVGSISIGQSLSTKPGISTSPKSTYETPEERAQKQIYIIRQSSISAAVASLGFGAKAPLKVEDVLALAKQFEDHVFGKKASGNSGISGFDDFEDVSFDTEVKVD